MRTEMDYRYSAKRHWRRSMWNAIRSRLRVPVDEAVVLYLPGPTDEDRPIALAKGFSAGNLIAIEKNVATVRTLRKSGILVVEGDFFKVATSWPASRRVDVVFADFCHGLRLHETAGFVPLSTMRQFHEAVFAVNLSRGRETKEDWAFALTLQKCLSGDKHRAKALFMAYLLQCGAFATGSVTGGRDGVVFLDGWRRLVKGFLDQHWLTLEGAIDPTFFCYRSTKHQTFDSAVWGNYFRGFNRNAIDFGAFPEAFASFTKSTSERRSLAAILAHRTMQSR
jgi:hypothetical protein